MEHCMPNFLFHNSHSGSWRTRENTCWSAWQPPPSPFTGIFSTTYVIYILCSILPKICFLYYKVNGWKQICAILYHSMESFFYTVHLFFMLSHKLKNPEWNVDEPDCLLPFFVIKVFLIFFITLQLFTKNFHCLFRFYMK